MAKTRKIQELKHQATELIAENKYRKAAELYQQLSELDEDDGEWPRRAADCFWHLKQSKERLEWSARAAGAYSHSGQLLKAIAMCKVVLSIDPEHRETQARLAELHARPAMRESRRSSSVHRQDKKRLSELGGREAMSQHQGAAAMLRRATAKRRKQLLSRPKEASTEHIAPPLRVERPPVSRRRPPLGAMQLSARVPSQPRLSVVPISTRTAPATPSQDPARARGNERTGSAPAIEVGDVNESQPSHEDIGTAHQAASHQDSAPEPEAFRRAESLGVTTFADPESDDSARSWPQAGWDEPMSFREEVQSSELEPIEPSSRKLAPGVISLVPPPVGLLRELEPDARALAEHDFAHVPLLGELSPDVLRELITEVGLLELDAGQELFCEGDQADAMYVVVEGSVIATTMPRGSKPTQVVHLEESEFFGEIGLLSDQPRQATVQAHEPCRLLRFDRDIVSVLIEYEPDFLATLLRFLRARLVSDFVSTSEMFAPLDDEQRDEVASRFEFLEIEPDCLLLQPGQPAIGMYVLLTGEAVLEGAGASGTRRRLGPGDLVGEQALLCEEPAAIRVETTSKCFALCLPSDAFPDLLDRFPSVMGYLSELEETTKGELEVTPEFVERFVFF